MKKQKLVFVTNSFSFGGSEQHLLQLLRRLDVHRLDIEILCTDSDPFTDRLDANLRQQIVIRVEKSLKSLGDWLRVFRQIKPDIVVLVYGTLWMLPWSAAAGARLSGVGRLYAIHHQPPIPPQEPPVLRIHSARDVWRRLCGRRVRLIASAGIPPRLCRKTICVSDAVRNALIKQHGFPVQKVVTIRNGISLDQFVQNRIGREEIRTRLKLQAMDFVLVCTTRLSPEKGIGTLVTAMSQVVKVAPDCKCIIVGDGYLRAYLARQIELLALERNVLLAGFQADVQPYLSAADAFVLTSDLEGLPYSVLEAMGCSLPCIVTDVGGNAEAVTQNVNGFVVRPGAANEVAEAILALMNNSEKRQEMGRASRRIAESKFDVEPRMTEIRQLLLGEV